MKGNALEKFQKLRSKMIHCFTKVTTGNKKQ